MFAYYENPDQRWEDKVLLETWDTNIMAQIAQYCEVGQDGKVVVENGSIKLKMLDIKCRCGFSHSVKDVARKDGSGTVTMNDLRCYRLEIGGASQQQTQQAQPTPAPQPAQQPNQVNQEGGGDDLPF